MVALGSSMWQNKPLTSQPRKREEEEGLLVPVPFKGMPIVLLEPVV